MKSRLKKRCQLVNQGMPREVTTNFIVSPHLPERRGKIILHPCLITWQGFRFIWKSEVWKETLLASRPMQKLAHTTHFPSPHKILHKENTSLLATHNSKMPSERARKQYPHFILPAHSAPSRPVSRSDSKRRALLVSRTQMRSREQQMQVQQRQQQRQQEMERQERLRLHRRSCDLSAVSPGQEEK